MRGRRSIAAGVLTAAALGSAVGGFAIVGALDQASASPPHVSPPVSRPVSPPVQNDQGQNNNDQGQNGNDQGQN
jgi:hypothetical protein